jgi:putative ABC transport system permease protein
MSAPQVVIVDQAFAQKYFPNQNPIGKHIKPSISMQEQPPWREIVGVVNNTKEIGMAEDFQPQYYIPYGQLPGPVPAIIVKTVGDALGIVPAVRGIMTSMDKDIPLYDVMKMDQLVSASEARERFNTLFLGAFGALALVLALLGIYGVVAYWVSQATHEIGLRIALGARHDEVMRLILRRGMKLVLTGVALGGLVSLALTRLMSSLLFDISPADPPTLAGVGLMLVFVALLACYIPARRAMRVDPMVALRYE